jgi:aminoglycoside phosphotransferase family enzyme
MEGDSAGRVCDHLVAMRRMPASRRLSALIQAREPVSAAVRQVARMLAAEHASAPRGPAVSEQGTAVHYESMHLVRHGLLEGLHCR